MLVCVFEVADRIRTYPISVSEGERNLEGAGWLERATNPCHRRSSYSYIATVVPRVRVHVKSRVCGSSRAPAENLLHSHIHKKVVLSHKY